MRRNGLVCALLAFYAASSCADSKPWKNNFGYEGGGWAFDRYPNVLADVNADDRADVVGFGDAGIYVSLSTGSGFSPPELWLDNFGSEAGGWQVEKHLRHLADVNADRRADAIGFGDAGVYVSLSTGTGFAQPELWLDNFGFEAGGWRVGRHPRFLVDVNADNRADIVGFGVAGIYVALSTGDGFTPPVLWVDLKNGKTDD
jgi:hypothetical protein